MKEASGGFHKLEQLVETDWLEGSFDDPDLRMFDCAVVGDWNPDPELSKKFPLVFDSGSASFDEGHVPGAGFIDLLNDISDTTSPWPLMMPPEQQFVTAMSD